MKKIVWNSYKTAIIGWSGYFAILMGVFATDDPRGGGVLAGLFVGVFLFAVLYGVFVWTPHKVYAMFGQRKELHKMAKEYKAMQITFRELFNQDLTESEIESKKGGIIGDEALPLGRYVWNEKYGYIEYYVHWLPHYRGDSHGKIYKNGKHESLPTLPQIGEVTQQELDLIEELKQKGLYVY